MVRIDWWENDWPINWSSIVGSEGALNHIHSFSYDSGPNHSYSMSLGPVFFTHRPLMDIVYHRAL